MRTRTKTVVAGGVVAVVLATGGVAVAATATPTTTPGHGHRGDRAPFARIEHGQFVTKDKAGAQVTHDIVTGTVTAVSGTSLSVKDGTGTVTAFTVGARTRVHVKGQAKGRRSTISAVKTGGDVTVLGTGTGPFTATSVRVQ